MLKAGLVKKSQVAQVAREQAKQRQGKAPPPVQEDRVDADRLRAERAERDRALAAERNAQARAHELRAQVRQIVDTQRVKHEGEIAYRFVDGAAIKQLWVQAAQRAQLASGALVVVRDGEDYALLPRAAAEKVRERDPGAIVLDHAAATPAPAAEASEDEAFYARFQVPDDLVW